MPSASYQEQIMDVAAAEERPGNPAAALDGIVMAMLTLSRFDIPAAIAEAKRAQIVASRLDRPLSRSVEQSLIEIRELLEAAMPLWRAGEKLRRN